MNVPYIYASDGILKIVEETRKNEGDFYFFRENFSGVDIPLYTLPSNYYEDEPDEVVEEVVEDEEGYSYTITYENKKEIIPSYIEIPEIYKMENLSNQEFLFIQNLVKNEYFYLNKLYDIFLEKLDVYDIFAPEFDIFCIFIYKNFIFLKRE